MRSQHKSQTTGLSRPHTKPRYKEDCVILEEDKTEIEVFTTLRTNRTAIFGEKEFKEE